MAMFCSASNGENKRIDAVQYCSYHISLLASRRFSHHHNSAAMARRVVVVATTAMRCGVDAGDKTNNNLIERYFVLQQHATCARFWLVKSTVKGCSPSRITHRALIVVVAHCSLSSLVVITHYRHRSSSFLFLFARRHHRCSLLVVITATTETCSITLFYSILPQQATRARFGKCTPSPGQGCSDGFS
jgi:hypothetical protein